MTFSNFLDKNCHKQNRNVYFLDALEPISTELTDIHLDGSQSVNLVWDINSKKKTDLEFIWEFTFECQAHTTNYEYIDASGGEKPIYAVANHASEINPDTGTCFHCWLGATIINIFRFGSVVD